MFVLDRRKGERFVIGGGTLRAHIEVLNVRDDQVRLGIRVLAEASVRPTDDDFRQANESNGGRKQDSGAPGRSRRPKRVWPPMELVRTGWY